MAVADGLKKLMKALHINQSELAGMSNITRSSITNYITGRRNPNCATVRRLVQIAKQNGLEMNFEDFINFTEETENDPNTQAG